MSDTTAQPSAPDPAAAAAVAAAERKGFYRGQVVATRAICEFFGGTVREMMAEGAVDEMLAQSRASHAEAVKNGETLARFDEETERAVVTERVAVIAAYLGKVVEAVGFGIHIDAPARHKLTDKAGAEWVVSKAP